MSDEPLSEFESLEVHLTVLVGWLVRRVGYALLWSLLAPMLIGIVAVLAEEPWILYLALIVGPFIFAVMLGSSKAPWPILAVEETEGE